MSRKLSRRALLGAAAVGWATVGSAVAQHVGQTEWAQLRAELQAGEYRRALTLASHIAGGHPEVAAGPALYAWLLQAGGQDRFAQRVLAEALIRRPDDRLLLDVRERLRAPWPRTDAALRAAGLAPAVEGAAAGVDARVTGSALLAADGRSAFVSAAMCEGVEVWGVRDGLGRTARTEGRTRVADGCVRIGLSSPLEPPPDLQAVARAPFAGSPGIGVEYAVTEDAAPAWPWLRGGFLGREGRLGLDLPPGPRGGPVFDLGGRLLGIALPGREGGDTLLHAAAFWPEASAGGVAPRLPQDLLYERALRITLQVVVLGA